MWMSNSYFCCFFPLKYRCCYQKKILFDEKMLNAKRINSSIRLDRITPVILSLKQCSCLTFQQLKRIYCKRSFQHASNQSINLCFQHRRIIVITYFLNGWLYKRSISKWILFFFISLYSQRKQFENRFVRLFVVVVVVHFISFISFKINKMDFPCYPAHCLRVVQLLSS